MIAEVFSRFGASFVIEGGARGADTLAYEEASRLSIPVAELRPDWGQYGKWAGLKRNQEMLDVGKPDEVWVFHDDIASSRGTADMIQRASRAGLHCYVFTHD